MIRFFRVKFWQFSSEKFLETDHVMVFMRDVYADGAGDGVDLALHANHL
jgi:hypothetical protein